MAKKNRAMDFKRELLTIHHQEDEKHEIPFVQINDREIFNQLVDISLLNPSSEHEYLLEITNPALAKLLLRNRKLDSHEIFLVYKVRLFPNSTLFNKKAQLNSTKYLTSQIRSFRLKSLSQLICMEDSIGLYVKDAYLTKFTFLYLEYVEFDKMLLVYLYHLGTLNARHDILCLSKHYKHNPRMPLWDGYIPQQGYRLMSLEDILKQLSKPP